MEGMLILTALVLLFAPTTQLHAAKLAEFDRLVRNIGTEVYIVDVNGLQRIGRLTAADDSGLRLGVPSGEVLISKQEVAEVDRRRDSVLDGTIKGALLGTLLGAVAFNGNARLWLGGVAFYGGLGFLFDAAVTARDPIYRSPPTKGR